MRVFEAIDKVLPIHNGLIDFSNYALRIGSGIT